MTSPRRFPPPWSVDHSPSTRRRCGPVHKSPAAVPLSLHSRQWEPAFDLDQKQILRCVFTSARLGECRRKRFRSTNMTTLKTLTIVAALLAGGTSLAIAQNGPATGGQSPVAGGANGGGWAGGSWYGGAPVYGYGYRHLYAYYPHYRHYRYRHY